MLIVQGYLVFNPGERDAFLSQSVEMMRSSRQEKGCLEYVLAADPVDPARAVLAERWASKEDLDAHLAAQGQGQSVQSNPPPAPISREIVRYEIAESVPM